MFKRVAVLTILPVIGALSNTVLKTASAASAPVTVAICPAAESPAGFLYKQEYFVADGAPEFLVVTHTPVNSAACSSTTILADGDVLWAGRAAAEHLASYINQIGLQGVFTPDTPAISEIVAIGEAPQIQNPQQLAPSDSGSLPMSSPPVRDHVSQPASQQFLQRGAWLWSPDLWRHEPEFIWQLQTQQQLSEIYISVVVDENGETTDSAALAQFIRGASARSLRVWVVVGDPHDVLPGNQAALENRINAFLTYNNSVPESAQLAGVQLDIEPYLLRGFSRAQSLWRERYVAVIQNVHQLLNGQMTMDLVMPAWWGSHPAWAEQLFAQLPVHHTRVSIMNYHTSPERLLLNAEPFLDWGQRSAVPIQIGVESGFLQDENQRRYRAHENTGELWLIPVADEHVFILFDRPQSNLNGKAFAYAFEYEVPASLYTFSGDMARLNSVLSELEPEWRVWSSFNGISIHGLDEKINLQ